MPAALDVNWTEVKMLALSVGVREAARRMGLPEDAVKQRSWREGWLANMPKSQALPVSMVRPVTGVTDGATALANAMKDDAQRGRAAALRVSRRALERVDRCDDDELILPETADVASKWIKSASVAGGYGAGESVAKINLHLTGAKPQTMDAEWSEVQETPSLDVNDY